MRRSLPLSNFTLPVKLNYRKELKIDKFKTYRKSFAALSLEYWIFIYDVRKLSRISFIEREIIEIWIKTLIEIVSIHWIHESCLLDKLVVDFLERGFRFLSLSLASPWPAALKNIQTRRRGNEKYICSRNFSGEFFERIVHTRNHDLVTRSQHRIWFIAMTYKNVQKYVHNMIMKITKYIF